MKYKFCILNFAAIRQPYFALLATEFSIQYHNYVDICDNNESIKRFEINGYYIQVNGFPISRRL